MAVYDKVYVIKLNEDLPGIKVRCSDVSEHPFRDLRVLIPLNFFLHVIF
jgi:hypothetical protein